jgi:hypothetical protein
MFYEAIHQRLVEYNDMKNKVEAMGQFCPQDMNKALRDVLIALVFLIIVYLALFMLAIYYAFKCAMINRWGMYIPVLLILGMIMPNIGGFFIIGTVIYGSLNCGSICDVPSDIRKSF